MDRRERRTCSGRDDMSIPSIRILPSMTGDIPNSDITKEDFPLPVRPQIPIYEQLKQ